MFDAVAAVVGRWLGLPVWTYDHRFDVVRVEVWRDAKPPQGIPVEIGQSDSRAVSR
jgi:hypothetical protein